MAPGSRGSMRLSLPSPMPIIAEDDASPPAVRPRSPSPGPATAGMPTYTGVGRLRQSRSRRSSAPDRAPGPSPRNGPWDQAKIARRGGWYRLCLMALLMIALIVGLAVGLTIGLRHKDQPEFVEQLPTELFPAGSYSFTAALSTVATACTIDPSTFQCFPFATYSPLSPDASSATFHWTIAPVTSYSYAISSPAGPFASAFPDRALTVLDANQDSERFVFNVTAPLEVVLSDSLGTGIQASSCWFNETVLTATLWTRTRATYPANVTALPEPRNASTTFAPWPYRVEVRLTQAPGPGVPDCRDAAGRPVGGDLHVQSTGAGAGDASSCQCVYENYGLQTGQTGNLTRVVGRKRMVG